jgi:hypothetical protein
MRAPVELPTLDSEHGDAPARMRAGRPVATITRGRYEQLTGRVKLLSWLSLVWMTVEGAVAIAAGIVAGSIALIGFGLDSAIEGFASVIIIWRFTGSRVMSQAAERRASKLRALATDCSREGGRSVQCSLCLDAVERLRIG